MNIKNLFNKNIMVASMTTAMLLSAVAPGAVSFGAAGGTQAPLQFQIGSKKATDYRGEHMLASAPYLINGVTMVPVRALAEGLQASIHLDSATKKITLSKDGLTVTLTLNSAELTGTYIKNVKLPVKVTAVKGVTFVPAKMVAQLLGAETLWNAKDKKITLHTGKAQAFQFHFDQSEEGWKGDFADLPVDYNPDIYELEYARELLPTAGNKTNYGLKLNGMNRSDDLFMYVTKKLEGLEPNKTYHATLAFDLYTDQSGGMMGVGGSPGESVFIKAGFVSKEPVKVKVDEGDHFFYKVNVDKGNQITDGEDMKLIGNMVQPNSELSGFQPVAKEYSTTLQSNEKGELYVIIGSDSGYEGLTTLYLDNINVKLSPQA
ncbi:copper amine oxidase N-terminal domain-containing protein [Paenibacillus sinopodophylli]|uniref:copper amine oxidase N-terminal domain-containing protein n=1 Tax=Paenibacillus sinopodophylli TaxID=1837342 RepID=UPI00110CF71A|nr:copper amine oxidase N-terminal domain-containing protein [Paenibacillus sinopodophylli]